MIILFTFERMFFPHLHKPRIGVVVAPSFHLSIYAWNPKFPISQKRIDVGDCVSMEVKCIVATCKVGWQLFLRKQGKLEELRGFWEWKKGNHNNGYECIR